MSWLKIIENILVVVDSHQIEHATKGEWELSLLRCLNSLLHEAGEHLVNIITHHLTYLLSRVIRLNTGFSLFHEIPK